MTQDERTEICSTCKNRSFSIKEGLLCKKTMEKPCFDISCEDYEKDADEVKKQEQFANELKESDKISGFLAFYVYWAIPIGILMTIIGFFVTPTSLADYNYSLCFLLSDVVWIALYLYFSIYTIYAFVKRKSDAVFIAKWTLALILVTNLLPILTDSAGTGVFNNPSRLISSCVWCVVFFLYLTLSEDVKDCIPKETRRLGKRNKVIVILSVVLPVLLLAGGFVELVARGGQLGLLAP